MRPTMCTWHQFALCTYTIRQKRGIHVRYLSGIPYAWHAGDNRIRQCRRCGDPFQDVTMMKSHWIGQQNCRAARTAATRPSPTHETATQKEYNSPALSWCGLDEMQAVAFTGLQDMAVLARNGLTGRPGEAHRVCTILCYGSKSRC